MIVLIIVFVALFIAGWAVGYVMGGDAAMAAVREALSKPLDRKV
jgi:hypothetical protein